MNKIKATGAALAIGAAAMFSMAPVFASTGDTSKMMVQCMGVNSCKGKGACKTATNACKGQNACKGKGVMMMSMKKCQKMHGTANSMNGAAPR